MQKLVTSGSYQNVQTGALELSADGRWQEGEEIELSGDSGN